MTREQEDASRGIDLARRVLLATADRDDAEVLRLLNTGSEGETKWAAGVLASCVWEAFLRANREDARKAARHLRLSANKLNEYAVLTQVQLIVRDAEEAL